MNRLNTKVTILITWLILCGASVACAAAPWSLDLPVTPPLPQKDSASDPIRGLVWDNALNAGTNIRYWSALAEDSERWEILFRWVAVVSGIFSFAFPFISRQYFTGSTARIGAGIAELVGVVTFGMSLMASLDHRDNYKDLASIQTRWANLKPEFDELFNVSHTLTKDELKSRYDALQKAKQGIIPLEPAGKDEALMHKSWVQEMHARGRDEFVAEVEKNRTKLNLQTN